MEKTLLSLLTFLTIGGIVLNPVYAEKKQGKGEIHKFKNEQEKVEPTEKEEQKESLKEKITEIKNTIKDKVVNGIKGTVSAVNGTSFTLVKDGKSYTINTTATTKFRRHYWGESSLKEILVGNSVVVFGQFTDDAKTTINAKLVRNLSVVKKKGVFFGRVQSINGNTLVVKADKKGNITVKTTNQTKFIARNSSSMTVDKIKVGDSIRIRGVYDQSTNTIDEVTEIKDFTYPVKPLPKVSTTITPTP